MLSSAYTILIEAELLTTRNSQLASSTRAQATEAHKRADPMETALRISLKDSDKSWLQEELEASLDSESNSELWTTTTADPSISTSSLRQ